MPDVKGHTGNSMGLRAAVMVAAAVGALGCPHTTPASDGGTGGGSTGGSSAGGSSAGGSSAGGTAVGGGGGGGGGAGSIALSDVCSQVSTVDCDYYVRCGLYSSAAACATALGPQLVPCTLETAGEVDAGRLSYDGAQEAQCFAAFQMLACDALLTMPIAPCTAAFPGRVSENGTCYFDVECANANDYCAFTNMYACGPGVCSPRIAIGQPAPQDFGCVSGADYFEGNCVADLPPGADCSPVDGGFQPRPCAAPSSCSNVSEADGGYQWFCALSAATGAPCVDLDAGISGCSGFETCYSNGQCGIRGGLDAGCEWALSNCAVDLWCNIGLDPPRCTPPSPIGGPCVFFECQHGACSGVQFQIDGGIAPGTCGPLPQLGESCTSFCDTGLYCDYTLQQCATLKAEGEPCMNGAECSTSVCLPGDGGSVCAKCGF